MVDPVEPSERACSALRDAWKAIRLADVDPSLAIPVAAKAARSATRARDVVASAVAEQAWGHALLQVGQVDLAVGHLRRSIGQGSRSGRPDLAAESRMKLAFALVQRGRPRSALREVDRAVEALGGVAGARARAQRAVILYHVGRLDEAFVDYQAAVQVLRRGDDRLALQRVVLNRGVLQAERYEFDAAVRDLTEAEALATELGRDLAVGIIAENLGFVAGQRGDVPAALAYLDRAEEIIGRHGGQVAPVLQDRAELLLSVGMVTEARGAAEQAVVVFCRERRGLKVPEMRLLLAQVELLDRDWAAARAHAREALRDFRRQDRPHWAALARLVDLRATLAAGQRSRISTGVTAAMVSALAANGRPLAAVQARLDAARVAAQRGQADTALEHLVVAQRAVRARGPAALRARGWYATALLRQHRGDQRGAARAARRGLRILDEH
ncbi:MAG TPA: tetratricopeptide repeat protein, partial [Umezawaea sp.]|nr:tetratricopeptide repeat protein [Umezawaea sp.]